MSRLPDNAPGDGSVVRALSILDSEMLAGIHALCFPVHDRWDAKSLSLTLALPTTRGWLAYRDGGPEAFILLQILPPECEILTFCVLPAFRRRGVGGHLLAHAVARAWESGCARVFLDVAEDNAAARSLYAGAGFQQIGRRDGYYARAGEAAKNALILSLSLASSSF